MGGELEVGGGTLIRDVLPLLSVGAQVRQPTRKELTRSLELRAREDADAQPGDMADGSRLGEA